MRSQIFSASMLLLLALLSGISIFTFRSASSFTEKLEAIIPPIAVLTLSILYMNFAEDLLRSNTSTRLFGLALLILFIYLFWNSGLINLISGKPMVIVGVDGIKLYEPYSTVFKPGVIRSVYTNAGYTVADIDVVVSKFLPIEHDKYTYGRFLIVEDARLVNSSLASPLFSVQVSVLANNTVIYKCRELVTVLYGSYAYSKGNCSIKVLGYRYIDGVHDLHILVTIPLTLPKEIRKCNVIGTPYLRDNYVYVKLSCPLNYNYRFMVDHSSIASKIYATGVNSVYYILYIPRSVALEYERLDIYSNGNLVQSIRLPIVYTGSPSKDFYVYKNQLQQTYKEYQYTYNRYVKATSTNNTKEVEQLKQQLDKLQKEIDYLTEKISNTNGYTTYQEQRFIDNRLIEYVLLIIVVLLLLIDLFRKR